MPNSSSRSHSDASAASPARIRRLGRRDAAIFIGSSAIGSFGLGVAAFYLNFLYRALGLDEAAIGTLAATLALGGVGGAAPAALLPRVVSRRGAVMVGGGITANGLICLLSFETLGPLAVGAALLGAGGIIVASSGGSLIADATAGVDRAAMFGRQIALGTVASFLAAFLAGALAAPVGSALGLGPRDADTIRVLMGLGGLVAGLSVLPALFLASPGVPRGGHAAPIRLRLMGRFLIIEALFGLGAGSFLPFVNLYFADRFGLDLFAVGLALGAIAAGGSLGALLHARLVAARLGAVRGVVTVELASLPFALVAAFAAGPLVAVAALAIRAALMYGASGTMNAFSQSSFSPAERAGVHAVFLLTWAAGSAVGSFASGHIRAALGPDGYTINLITLATAYLIAATATWLLFRDHEPRGDAITTPAPHSAP